MAVDAGRIAAAVSELLAAIGDDPRRAGLTETPRRVAEAYAEFFAGVGADPLAPLREALHDPSAVTSGPVLLKDVAFRSICEHHLLPFDGVAHLGYQPGPRLVGLGRLVAVLEILSARPQLQERLTEQVADALHEGLEALGVIVVLEARHQCVAARGPRQAESRTVTLATRGVFDEPSRRAEAMGLLTS